MRLDGPVLIAAEDPASPLVLALSAAIANGAVPVSHAEAPAVVRATAPAAIVVLDGAAHQAGADLADDLTASVLSSDAFIPVIRRWSETDADRPTTLWLAADADTDTICAALQRIGRLSQTLSDSLRRRTVAKAAALGTFLPPDPWAPGRSAALLVVDNGAVLPRIAPVSAAHGMSLVGAPTTTLAGTYLGLRHFDAVILGPSVPRAAAEDFLVWLRDDPRWRELPALWLDADPAFALRFGYPSEILASRDPRLPATLAAAARLSAFGDELAALVADLHGAGLADPDGLLWPDVFRSGLAQLMAGMGTAHELIALRIDAGFGPPLPRAVPRIVARLLRRSDLITRIDDRLVLALLSGSDCDSARAIARRISGVLGHTALVDGGSSAPIDVRCIHAAPGESGHAFLARLTAAPEPADEDRAAAR